jgi:hypothetical protein
LISVWKTAEGPRKPLAGERENGRKREMENLPFSRSPAKMARRGLTEERKKEENANNLPSSLLLLRKPIPNE